MYEYPELFAYNILSVAYTLENILQFGHFFRHLGSIVGHLFHFLHFVELRFFGVSGFNLRSPLNHFRAVARFDVFPVFGADGQCVVGSLLDNPRTVFLVFAQPASEEIVAVRSGVFGHNGSRQ